MTVALAYFAQAGLGPSLYAVRSTFFCGSALCPDYKAKWAVGLPQPQSCINSPVPVVCRRTTAPVCGSLFYWQCFAVICAAQTLLSGTIKPMLAEGSLFGVFFGDEICWSCTPWSNAATAEHCQHTASPPAAGPAPPGPNPVEHSQHAVNIRFLVSDYTTGL